MDGDKRLPERNKATQLRREEKNVNSFSQLQHEENKPKREILKRDEDSTTQPPTSLKHDEDKPTREILKRGEKSHENPKDNSSLAKDESQTAILHHSETSPDEESNFAQTTQADTPYPQNDEPVQHENDNSTQYEEPGQQNPAQQDLATVTASPISAAITISTI